MLKLRSNIDFIIKWLLIILMALMVLNVLWQVFTRFILRDPSSFTDELSRYLLIWVGLLGAAYISGKKMHLALTFLVDKFPSKARKFVDIIIEILIFLFALFVMVIGGFNLVFLTLYLHQISASLQIELGYIYIIVPISGILIMFYSAIIILEKLKTANNNK